MQRRGATRGSGFRVQGLRFRVCGLGGWAERMGALRKNHENNLLPAGANAAAAGAKSSTNALLILIYFGRHDAEPGGESGSVRSQESGAGAKHSRKVGSECGSRKTLNFFRTCAARFGANTGLGSGMARDRWRSVSPGPPPPNACCASLHTFTAGKGRGPCP